MSAIKQKKYTYQDYLAWSDEERWEIIDGVPHNMAPAPIRKHQDIVLSFGAFLKIALTGKRCKVYIAPRDVVLSDENIVQPDVLVVCDPKKDTEDCIWGAPDVIVEVLSPSTERRDRMEKKSLYERFGVKEYVLISPQGKYAEVYRLQKHRGYDQGQSFGVDETMILLSLDKMEIPLASIFN